MSSRSFMNAFDGYRYAIASITRHGEVFSYKARDICKRYCEQLALNIIRVYFDLSVQDRRKKQGQLLDFLHSFNVNEIYSIKLKLACKNLQLFEILYYANKKKNKTYETIISNLKLAKNEPEDFKILFQLIKRGPKIVLIGTPHHGNIGDHLIAQSEIDFLERHCSDFSVVDCSMRFSTTKLDEIKRCLTRQDIVAISGGGWLGTEWKQHENFVRHIIYTFSNNKVLVFPQTAFYKDDNGFMLTGARIYNSHSDMLFCARDIGTYELYKTHNFINKKSKLLYMPDMALYSKLWREKPIEKNSKKVGLCIRDDVEACFTRDDIDRVIRIIETAGLNYKNVRTNEVENSIKASDRNKNIMRKLKEIASYDLLVTDRLHAMIMAAITNTPCIAFDNTTHKVKGVYDWIRELDYICLLNNIEDLSQAINRMLNAEFTTLFSDWDKSEYLELVCDWIHNS